MKLTEQKQADILRAASEEFRARGFVATSMDAIAARAQVSKRTVYNHFTSKAELFRAIVMELFECAQAAVSLPYDPHAPLAAQLQTIADKEVELLLSQEFIDLARTTLVECIRSPELARDAFIRLQQEGSALEGWVKAAADDGRLRVDDPILAAGQFLALIKSDIFWPQLFSGQPAPPEPRRRQIIDEAVGMFLDHYANEPPRE